MFFYFINETKYAEPLIFCEAKYFRGLRLPISRREIPLSRKSVFVNPIFSAGRKKQVFCDISLARCDIFALRQMRYILALLVCDMCELRSHAAACAAKRSTCFRKCFFYLIISVCRAVLCFRDDLVDIREGVRSLGEVLDEVALGSGSARSLFKRIGGDIGRELYAEV